MRSITSMFRERRNCVAFTLVEMLVAMAITLLMMVAVARAFAFVGERVRDSRGSIGLSSDLRDITTRLDDELRRCTVSLDPVDGNEPEPPGYFLYYEGPCTDATSTIFGRSNSTIQDGSNVAQDSRYGDLDDYLAFTAVAAPGTWFTGQVPAYVLDASLDPATEPAANNPVIIRSRYAEIVYFINPERNSAGAIIDTDGDLIADRLLLYRRVLLIRPDLNLGTGGIVLRLSPGTNWQTGMAGVHQLVDLSIRRTLNTDGTPNLTASAGVIANSLTDLAQPHNRFGHVRVPWGTVGGGGGTANDTSMPVLALEPPIDLILSATDGTGTGTPPTYRPVLGGTSTAPVVTDANWSGYLRREFVLNGTRSGEDVIANNCRALDVQIFDPNAAFYLSSNNLLIGPGDAGYREVLIGTATSPTLVAGGGFVDLAYPVLAGGAMRGWQARRIATHPSVATNPGNAAILPNLITSGSDTLNLTRIQSDFSGLEFANGATAFPTTAGTKTYTNALLKSGRLIISNSGQIVLFQPAFDTYTSAYENDGLLQDKRISGAVVLGTFWNQFNVADADLTDLAADGIDIATSPIYANGVDDFTERETSSPFLQKPEAIRVTVRLENVGTRQLRQSSVVHRDDR